MALLNHSSTSQVLVLLSLLSLSGCIAFAPSFKAANALASPQSATTLSAQHKGSLDRRNFLVSAAALLPATTVFAPNAFAAASETTSLIEEVETTRQKLDPIPGLLQAGEWDQVRSILKTPPVNYLWNMGDSKNPIFKLAQATDEFDLIDMKDEISISLQMCDQLTYDNVFVYFQPGNGKVKVKEPTDLALKAMKQIDDALTIAKGSL